ncbi:MAG: hypothetical protein NTZ12_08135 [Candidatus Aminicenantes bacterium]|nr:hypothetical protein [Candidatus Aminicenantes bacterium]
METEEKGSIASALARQAVAEGEGALKVIVAPDGDLAGMVFTLLTRVHQVSKDKITQIGHSCSDQQIDQLLKQKCPFVVVPRDIIDNRPCIFFLPAGTSRLVAVQFLDGEIFSMPIACEGVEFQFKPGWFS